jgi:hypothetical protein
MPKIQSHSNTFTSSPFGGTLILSILDIGKT